MTFINKTTLTEKTKSQISDLETAIFRFYMQRQDKVEKGMCIWEGQIHGEGGSLRTVWEATNQQKQVSRTKDTKICTELISGLETKWLMDSGGKENKAKRAQQRSSDESVRKNPLVKHIEESLVLKAS